MDRATRLNQRRLLWVSRIRAGRVPIQQVAAYVLELGDYFPNEREFLRQMIGCSTPSPKQLDWLNKIRHRNHI
jgi:hypothetical protein